MATANANVKVEELTFKLHDGHPVYMKKWTPATTTPLAKLVFIHGYDDHINRYFDLFPTLAGRGIAVTAWDQRGWGRTVRSTSDRGLTGPTSLVLADIAHVVRSELDAAEASSTPLFVMGHSMGGAEALILASEAAYADLAQRIRGWVLESPHVELAPGREPSALKVVAGRLAGKLLPRFQLKNKLPPEELTRDPEVMKVPLHNVVTLLGQEGVESLRKQVPGIMRHELVVIKDRHETVKVRMMLWKLEAYLANPDRE